MRRSLLVGFVLPLALVSSLARPSPAGDPAPRERKLQQVDAAMRKIQGSLRLRFSAADLSAPVDLSGPDAAFRKLQLSGTELEKLWEEVRSQAGRFERFRQLLLKGKEPEFAGEAGALCRVFEVPVEHREALLRRYRELWQAARRKEESAAAATSRLAGSAGTVESVRRTLAADSGIDAAAAARTMDGSAARGGLEAGPAASAGTPSRDGTGDGPARVPEAVLATTAQEQVPPSAAAAAPDLAGSFSRSAEKAVLAALFASPVAGGAAQRAAESDILGLLRESPEVAGADLASARGADGELRRGLQTRLKTGEVLFESHDGLSVVTSSDGLTVVEIDRKREGFRKTVAGETVVSWSRDPATGGLAGRFHGIGFGVAPGETLSLSPDGSAVLLLGEKDGKRGLKGWITKNGRGAPLPDGLGETLWYKEGDGTHRSVTFDPARVTERGALDLSGVPDRFVPADAKAAFGGLYRRLAELGLAQPGVAPRSIRINDGRLCLGWGEGAAGGRGLTAELEDSAAGRRLKVFLWEGGSATAMLDCDPALASCDRYRRDDRDGRVFFKREDGTGKTEEASLLRSALSAGWYLGSGALRLVGAAGEVVLSPFQTLAHGGKFLYYKGFGAAGRVTGLSGDDWDTYSAFMQEYTLRQAKLFEYFESGAALLRGEDRARSRRAALHRLYDETMALRTPEQQRWVRDYLDSEVLKQRERLGGELQRFQRGAPIGEDERRDMAAQVFGASNVSGQYFREAEDAYLSGGVSLSAAGNWAVGFGATFGDAAVEFGMLKGVTQLAARTAVMKYGADAEKTAAVLKRLEGYQHAFFTAPIVGGMADSTAGLLRSYQDGDPVGATECASALSRDAAFLAGIPAVRAAFGYLRSLRQGEAAEAGPGIAGDPVAPGLALERLDRYFRVIEEADAARGPRSPAALREALSRGGPSGLSRRLSAELPPRIMAEVQGRARGLDALGKEQVLEFLRATRPELSPAEARAEAEKTAAELSGRFQTAEVTINFDPMKLLKDGSGVLDGFERDPYYRNFFETGATGGLTGKRRAVEDRMIRALRDQPGSGRPKYAALNLSGDEAGAAPKYGEAYFVLKEPVKRRSTLTPEDSLDMNAVPENLGTFETPFALLRSLDRSALKELARPGTGTKPPYMEVQVHGPLRIDNKGGAGDVQALAAPARWRGTATGARLEKFAAERGVPMRWYGSPEPARGSGKIVVDSSWMVSEETAAVMREQGIIFPTDASHLRLGLAKHYLSNALDSPEFDRALAPFRGKYLGGVSATQFQGAVRSALEKAPIQLLPSGNPDIANAAALVGNFVGEKTQRIFFNAEFTEGGRTFEVACTLLHELIHYAFGEGEHPAHEAQSAAYEVIKGELKRLQLNMDLTPADRPYASSEVSRLYDRKLSRQTAAIAAGRLTQFLLDDAGYAPETLWKNPTDARALRTHRLQALRDRQGDYADVLAVAHALEKRLGSPPMAPEAEQAWERETFASPKLLGIHGAINSILGDIPDPAQALRLRHTLALRLAESYSEDVAALTRELQTR